MQGHRTSGDGHDASTSDRERELAALQLIYRAICEALTVAPPESVTATVFGGPLLDDIAFRLDALGDSLR